MNTSRMKLSAGIAALVLAGCVVPPQGQQPQVGSVAVPASSGGAGCKRLATTTAAENAGIGAVAGALAAGVLRSTAGGSRVAVRNTALLGALTGAVAGSQYNALMGLTELPDGSVKMNIPGSVLFRSGSADLNPNFQQTLNQIASTIRDYCGLTAAIVGHTDSVGSHGENQRLSERRAQAVVAYLQAQRVEGYRLAAEGRASDQPVAPNTDESGRAANRRVEIFVRPPAS